MSYTAAFEPKVIRNYPSSLSKEISTKTVIRVDFNTDLDRDYIEPHFQVLNHEGTRISGKITYDEKTVSFKPDELFPSNETIKVLIIGDDLSGKGQGIRSVLGEKMRGNFMFTFATAAVPQLPAPSLKYPADQSVVRKEPSFDWTPVEGAAHYHIQVSTSNSMSPVFWPAHEAEHAVFASVDPLSPDISFPDDTYYWRMRAVAADGTVGEWSALAQFNKDTQREGFVSEGDIPFEDTVYDMDVDILDVFPQDKFSNVATNLKTIYVQVMGVYTTEEVQGAFSMTGSRVDQDDTDAELIHGDIVPESITAIPQADGTTIIALQLPPLEAVE